MDRIGLESSRNMLDDGQHLFVLVLSPDNTQVRASDGNAREGNSKTHRRCGIELLHWPVRKQMGQEFLNDSQMFPYDRLL